MTDFMLGKTGVDVKIPLEFNLDEGSSGAKFRDAIHDVLVDNNVIDDRRSCTVAIPENRFIKILPRLNLGSSISFTVRDMGGKRVGTGKMYQKAEEINGQLNPYLAKDFFVRMSQRAITRTEKKCSLYPGIGQK